MRIVVLAICLALGLSACERSATTHTTNTSETVQTGNESGPETARLVGTATPEIATLNDAPLPDLSLAQLHRDDRGAYRWCDRAGEAGWQCDDTTVEYAITAQVAPTSVAPFLAQIYLHPEHVTEAFIHQVKRYDRAVWELRHACGGALIAPGWVVTAAHCFPNPNVDQKYGIRLGVQDIAYDAGHLYNVVEVIRRDPDKPSRDNDIALVRFDPTQSEATAVSFAQLMGMAPDLPGIIGARFEKDGTWLGAITNDGHYHVVDPVTLNTRLSIPFFRNIETLAEQNAVLTLEEGSAIQIIPMDGTTVQRIEFDGVTGAKLVDGGALLVGWSTETGEVKIFNRRTGERLREHIAEIRVDFVSEILNSPRLALGTHGGGIEVIDMFPAPEMSGTAISVALSQSIRPVGLLADNRRIVYEYRPTQTYYLHDTVDDVAVAAIESYGFPMTLSEGKTKIVRQFPEQLDILDAMSGVTVAQIPVFNAAAEIAVTFLDQDRLVLIQDRAGKFAEIWDLTTTARRAFLTPPSAVERIETATLFPDNDAVLVRTRQETVYQSATSEDVLVPERHRFYLSPQSHPSKMIPLLASHALAGLPVEFDGSYSVLRPSATDLIVWSEQGRSFYWDLSQCEPVATTCEATRAYEHDTRTKGVQLSKDAQHLIATMANGSIQVWPIAQEQDPITLYHGGDVRGVEWVDNGRQLMSYGLNGYLRFWDIETGKERARLDFADSVPDAQYNASPDYVVAQPDIGSDADAQTGPDPAPIVTYVDIDTTGEALKDGAPVRVFGWGRFEGFVGGQRSQQLREANLEVMSLAACSHSSRHSASRNDLHERVFCAHDVTRKTCVGDSGGPVIHGETLADAKLVGLTSWGSKYCVSDGMPGVYTRIASHAEWIKSVIQKDVATAEAVTE